MGAFLRPTAEREQGREAPEVEVVSLPEPAEVTEAAEAAEVEIEESKPKTRARRPPAPKE